MDEPKDAGRICAAYHSRTVQNVKASRVQCDEIWSFVAAKQKNVKTMKAAPEVAGDVWTWTALDADRQAALLAISSTRHDRYAQQGRDAGNGRRA